MSTALPREYHAADAIEWEELPSLASSLVRRLANENAAQPRGANDSDFMPTAAATWDNTLPAELDPRPVSPPFREALDGGLATREVLEPDVFRHFFGQPSAD